MLNNSSLNLISLKRLEALLVLTFTELIIYQATKSSEYRGFIDCGSSSIWPYGAYSQPEPPLLPIPVRLEFKILLLTYKCLHNEGHLTCVSYSSFATLHAHVALPQNPYFSTRTAPTPSTMATRRLPSLLLNCGTLYLNRLSQPCPGQLLKRHLKLTFSAAIFSMNNDTLVV